MYDSRRAGLNLFMEDVDWMRHNCILFNGVRKRNVEMLRRCDQDVTSLTAAPGCYLASSCGFSYAAVAPKGMM